MDGVKSIRYRGTNCFFIQGGPGAGLLAIDAGWPCTLDEYRRLMKSGGLRFADIRLAVVTHFHLDHAGLLGEFIRSGIRCLAFENQADAYPEMERLILRNPLYRGYRRIAPEGLIPAGPGRFREEMEKLGLSVAAIAVSSHSGDSVAYVVSRREAVVGDLVPPDQLMPDDAAASADWERIRAAGAVRIYPSHAPAFSLAERRTTPGGS